MYNENKREMMHIYLQIIHQILTICVSPKCSIFHSSQYIIRLYEPASMHVS